jgi:hypothetical protein
LVVCATLFLPECNPTRPAGHGELIQIKAARSRAVPPPAMAGYA